jgi:hypothetical protein
VLQSGTSCAAPQVSGAAALDLHAILSGVDVLPDFVGKTVTSSGCGTSGASC